MRRLISFIAVMTLFIGFSSVYSAELLVREGETLSLERCLQMAIKNQPTILQYLYTVQMNEAVLGQVKSSYYPQLDVTTGYTRYNAVTQYGDPYTTVSQYGYKYFDQNMAVKQKIYDFGKRESSVDVARLNLQSSRADMENQIAAVISTVKASYYDVLRAKRSRDVNLEARDQYRQQLAQARFFFESGKKPKYDVTTAEVNLSMAEVNLINGENDLENAWVTLNNAMGYDGASRYTIQDIPVIEPYEVTEKEAVEQAFKNREDLKSLVAQQESAQKAVDVARKDYYPSLDASAGYDFVGSQTPLSQGWNAGVSLSWNLFKGFSTQKGIEKALANLKVIEAKIASLKLTIHQDIKKAILSLKKAKETMASAEIQVRQATENLELANLRYRAGLGTPVDVTNATVAYSNAKLTHITAVYNALTARTNIERAIGYRK